jgi:chitin synthase
VGLICLVLHLVDSLVPPYLSGRDEALRHSDGMAQEVTICFLIFGLCGTVVFYIVIFGRLICPEFDHAWDLDELKGHIAAIGTCLFWTGD